MTAEIFNDPITEMVPVAATSTDGNSPNTSLLETKFRVWLEMLLAGVFGLFRTGSLTSDPPNDTTGYAEDTAAGFVDDEHNDRRIIFTSGNAVCQDFLIDDTDATNNRVVCTGDNLYSVGVRSGDDYIIVGNFRNALGHIHDGRNARNYVQYKSLIFSADVSIISASASWYTACKVEVYIPEDSQTITIKIYGSVNGGTGYYRFTLDGSASNTVTTTSTSAILLSDLTLDVSAFSAGFHTMEIQIHNNGTNTVGVQCLNAFIE